MSQQKSQPARAPFPLWTFFKTTSLLFVISFLISCDSADELPCLTSIASLQTDCSQAENKKAAIEEISLGHDAEIPGAALTFGTQTTLLNFSEQEKAKLIQATEIIKKVVASREFRDGILNHTWDGKKQFANNQGFSNAEIYQKILHASESYLTDKNNVLDVELELFFEPTKTIGYTYPNTKRIWMNKKYYDKYTPIQVSDNLFHEWLHKIGFDHSTTWSKERDHSVPYAIGYLVEKIAHKMHLSQSTEIIGLN